MFDSISNIFWTFIAAVAIAHWVFGISFPDIVAWLKKEGASLRAKVKALETNASADIAAVKSDFAALEAKVKGWFEGHAAGTATASAAANTAAATKSPPTT